jgi:hypothetical protein
MRFCRAGGRATVRADHDVGGVAGGRRIDRLGAEPVGREADDVALVCVALATTRVVVSCRLVERQQVPGAIGGPSKSCRS